MKMCKNGDFQHISGIFSWKKVFLKNRTWPYFGHCYYAFLYKESVKTNDEISRKRQKPVFPAYFRHFRPEKYVIYKVLAFCISVRNFMKKYKVQLEKFKKYRFSGENRLF